MPSQYSIVVVYYGMSRIYSITKKNQIDIFKNYSVLSNFVSIHPLFEGFYFLNIRASLCLERLRSKYAENNTVKSLYVPLTVAKNSKYFQGRIQNFSLEGASIPSRGRLPQYFINIFRKTL